MASIAASSTVLIMDGDESIRSTLRMLLETEGYVVLEAEMPSEALAVLRAIPDCIILIFSNTEPIDHPALAFFTAVAADLVLATRHVYIYLTTVPQRMLPTLVTVLATLGALVLAKPFEIVRLLDAVDAATARLP